jgi:UrcA family protein
VILLTVRSLAIAVLGVTLACLSAVAQSPEASVLVIGRDGDVEIRARIVRFADLNLAQRAEISALYRRINAAAALVCSPLSGARDLSLQERWRTCRDTAIARAVAKIDHPLLTERHRRSTSAGVEDV